MGASDIPQNRPHVPVLLESLLDAVQPISGIWIDGTFGAGGYTRGFLEQGAGKVIGIDRDPNAAKAGQMFKAEFGDRFDLVQDTFSNLASVTDVADGVVLDIGVSSMQIDNADRGFSFQKDGPLDMRMGADGPTAADLVNGLPEAELADILFQFGEERASRRIARKICARRKTEKFERTLDLANVVASVLPRPKPNQPNPATRTFQALRVAVNSELTELVRALVGAEQVLKTGGLLAVVTFHSLEDRIVKRFFQDRGAGSQGSRYMPETEVNAPIFEVLSKKPIAATDEEIDQNPRSRSAKLRIGRRTTAPSRPVDYTALGLPKLVLEGEL